MENKYLVIALLSMALAIAFGALGAHALKKIFEETVLDAWKTAVFYQIVHSLGIMIIIVIARVYGINEINTVLNLMVIGFVAFSFSIYILSFNSIWNIDILGKIFGPVTPIGGLLMISAWVLFSVKILRIKL